MPGKAKAYWTLTVLLGAAISATGFYRWSPDRVGLSRLFVYLLIAVLSSRWKVRLPTAFGTLSMNYVFITLTLLDLDLGSALLVGMSSTIAQSLIRPKHKPRWEQVTFNALTMAIPILITGQVLHMGLIRSFEPNGIISLISGSMSFFLINTFNVALMIGLSSQKPPFATWRDSFLWTWPQYLVGGSIAGGLHIVTRVMGWPGLILALPPLYLIYRSYNLYVERVEQQQKHVSDMADLHWRTIETLALAIEAKDDTTAAHLRRVEVYASEIAAELRVSPAELQAVRAAALLHDIGKLAVPEHIISKPGRLTPEEFDKMKIHPIVGAEILERVNFPYPVVPIVRSHHERFDGTGYPDGLAGEAIPIGARILSAVDCLDALASDRQYRRALPLDQAMEIVTQDSGKAFDPRVVEILARRYRELELKAKADHSELPKMSNNIKVTRGAAPAAGFAHSGQSSPTACSLSANEERREVQLLVEMVNGLGKTSDLDEALTLFTIRLSKLIAHDALVIYLADAESLAPRFVIGENFRQLSSCPVPVGQGLSGWVADNDMPIVNGNPSVEPWHAVDRQPSDALRSAISIPLHGRDRLIGVLTLYHSNPDAFTQDHLRVLLAISSHAGLAIERSSQLLRSDRPENTDHVTGLLNAHAFPKILDTEILENRPAVRGCTLLLLSLENLDRVASERGPEAADQIRRQFARFLRASFRPGDFAGYLDANRFGLVLLGADGARTAQIRHEIHQFVSGLAPSDESNSPTVRLAEASVPRDGATAADLLASAELRLLTPAGALAARRVA